MATYPSLLGRLLTRAVIARVSDRVCSACWLWPSVDRYGYGLIAVDGKTQLAHRVAFRLFRGPVPDGMQLDHLCRQRNCINAFHLDPVDNDTNCVRGNGFVVANRSKVACINGHPFDDANTYSRPRGGRGCRSCNADAARKCRVLRCAA